MVFEKFSVSVIISTHNRTKRLKKCLKSILSNTVLPKEIVIVDDSDKGKDCKKMISRLKSIHLKVKIIYERSYPKKGVAFSRNLGVKLSSGKIISFIDDDCDAHKDWIKNTIISYSSFPETFAITGLILPSYPKNYWNRVWYKFHEDKEYKIYLKEFLHGANYTLKKEVFFKYKIFFDERNQYCSEDSHITARLIKRRFLFMYDPRIIVFHDFRTNIFSVFRQWFRYGVSDYNIWQLNPNCHFGDSYFFRQRLVILKVPFWIIKKL